MYSNPAAERAVLAGITSYSAEAYFDISDIITETTFTVPSNQIIYKCLKHIIETNNDSKIDIPSIYSAATTLGLGYVFEKKQEANYLQAILSFPIDQKNVRRLAQQIKKLEIIRGLKKSLAIAEDNLNELTGEESITKILSVAEDVIFNFSASMTDGGGPQLLGDGIMEYLEEVIADPVDEVGISTGFKKFDQAIGGGLTAGVHMVGARIKVGKSYLSANVGDHISSNNIPVLYLDTEMQKKTQVPRLLAIKSKVSTKDIKTGKFGLEQDKKTRVFSAAKKVSQQPFWYKNISGTSFEEQAAIMRRWICKDVGLELDGTAKQCVIIYDYVKLMDDSSLKNMAEHQALGFLMTNLHNFAIKYNVPILGLCQLNRDGIDNETTGTAAGSDRILWLCTSFSIYKPKSDEEIAQDGPDNGNRKMVVLACREGGGTESHDYINFNFEGWCGKITEGKTALEIASNNARNPVVDTGFEINESDNIVPFE